MKVRPLSQETLVSELVQRIVPLPGRARVIIDGAFGTGELADALVEPLRTLGRPAVRVSTTDFLRPASLRLEHGRTDPYSYRHDWFDFGGLQREVLDSGDKVLPSLWNAATDRASRADYVELPDSGVVLVDGTLLLDRWLPADLTVHLWLSPAALRRRTDPDLQWTIPAYDDYEPVADVNVRYDHPERPGLVVS
ncbi:uridine kinase [Lentzea sp. NBRC 105346]|uniref:uridine kinase n=1 Tax=Lentzea sp. NBRC 105346 TaxID=3032205 RepID=UPI0024A229B1|nr:uridine kinase [Lentzea sp. NBRC 105346]GLZ32155.1 uridine kinase [Lentzea sp. NBRC 105346]